MRSSMRQLAAFALCAVLAAAAPATAAASSPAHTAAARAHRRKHRPAPLAPQGNGGALYGSPAPTAAPSPSDTTNGAGLPTGGTVAGTTTNAVTRGASGGSSGSGATGAEGATGATLAGGASAPAGSTGASGSTGATGPSGPTGPSVPVAPGWRARILPDGLAEAPADAPTAVREAIAAGNQLIGQPYVYGGGHRSFVSNGYDCSGAVSYALHGGGLLASPLDSTQFESWGLSGPGTWITVYTNPAHAYMTIAGIRFDTSTAGDPGGKSGPRWRPLLKSNAGFLVRHPAGL